MQCTRCRVGGELTRTRRKGFMEEHVFSFFGYYPWRCSSCKQRTLRKKRSERRGSHSEASFNEKAHPL
jgi:hypothetical protein